MQQNSTFLGSHCDSVTGANELKINTYKKNKCLYSARAASVTSVLIVIVEGSKSALT